MDMQTVMDMAAELLRDMGLSEEIEEEGTAIADEVLEEIFKDVPDSLEGDEDDIEDPEWDEGTTEEQKEETCREMREESKRFNKAIDDWFDQMVADGIIVNSLG